jgi:hypothetical protein
MAQRLLGMGIQPGKVWAFAQGKSFKKFKNLPVNLVVRTPHHPAGMVRWSYHVAPTIRVRRADGSVQMMVIDPSLFHEPVTIKKWLAVQTNGSKKPFVSKTRLGQPPLLPNGKRARGHGYWPANDPGDPDAHARAKMKEFKKKAAARHLAAIWSAPLSSAA